MKTTYHASTTDSLTAIIAGHGDYAGIFTSENVALTAKVDYGIYVYRVTFETVCSKTDIEDYLESNPAFLVENPKFVVDCDESEDDHYFQNQKLRAIIAIELGFDAVEENDGWLVVNGTVELIGHKDSEAVETEIEYNW